LISPAQKHLALYKTQGIAIGANSVVNKSFTEPNIGIAGVPAIKINDKGSENLLPNKALEALKENYPELFKKSKE